jgi:hypothetical protein
MIWREVGSKYTIHINTDREKLRLQIKGKFHVNCNDFHGNNFNVGPSDMNLMALQVHFLAQNFWSKVPQDTDFIHGTKRRYKKRQLRITFTRVEMRWGWFLWIQNPALMCSKVVANFAIYNLSNPHPYHIISNQTSLSALLNLHETRRLKFQKFCKISFYTLSTPQTTKAPREDTTYRVITNKVYTYRNVIYD